MNLIDIFNLYLYTAIVYMTATGHQDFVYAYNRVVLELESWVN